MATGITLEQITGTVERITYHSEENGFFVIRAKIRGKRDLVTVVGSAAKINAGERIECSGTWINDKNYGLQFKANTLKISHPITIEGIEKYLASGFIKGIGPHFAKILINTFGEKVFHVFENEPDKLKHAKGIGEKRKEFIIKAWSEQKAIRDIMIFLQSNGIGTSRAVRIYKTYGDDAIEIILENPYRLASDIYGIGFKTADILAMKIGVEKTSIKRAQAGIHYALKEFASHGNCAVEQENLIDTSSTLLDIPKEIITTALQHEINAETLIQDKIKGEEHIFLKELFIAETSCAKHIAKLKDGHPPWGKLNIEQALKWVEKYTKIILSQSQKQAVISALEEKLLIITGGPGVGKTTIVNSIIKILLAKNVNVSLCAPTGRAAKRMTETTGVMAKTIHRMLEFDPKTYSFKRNQHNKLQLDLLIIDEASMVDVVLFNHLLKAIPLHASLIIVGDADQLPSVGPGEILKDMIKSQAIPTVILTEIFRQASTSKIIVNAHRVNEGKFPLRNDIDQKSPSDFYVINADSTEEIQEKLIAVVTKNIPNKFGYEPLTDIQILSPMNRGGLGTHLLNNLLQEKLNPNISKSVSRFGYNFRINDKVIQNVNNYDKDVFNGDIGQIVGIDLEMSSLNINFYGREIEYDFNELDEISLAYAISIHKSQGSEYKAIVIPIATQHYMLLNRNLLYTAITRGKNLVVIVGQPKAIAIAIHSVCKESRITKLAERLNGLIIGDWHTKEVLDIVDDSCAHVIPAFIDTVK